MNGSSGLLNGILLATLLFAGGLSAADPGAQATRNIPAVHPRLLGSRERLQKLARERPEAYARVVEVARNRQADAHSKMVSIGLVCAIEGDTVLGKEAVKLAMKYIDAPIRIGHETFGHDMANCALVYDLCYPSWLPEEREKFIEYMNKTVDANVNSETSPFHNAWWGYKHWGYGLACYATWYENPRAPEILAETERDYRERAAPALELSGNGGGFAEGYYINYWLYEWLFFCEVSRLCEGVDRYALAPDFYRERTVACMFEAYPGIREYGTRRPIPIGDGGGRVYGGDRDKSLSARRILVNFFRDDPDNQVVNAFNETTPVSGGTANAYKDFLWRDTTVTRGDLKNFKLSLYSPGPGYIYARSAWEEDATYFFFKCGDRFTSHQHLDVGNFLIYKYEELAGDGGHYESFGSEHDVNYHLRTLAHNTILMYDPRETWPDIRASVRQFGGEIVNDGGQHHNWPHHNGAVQDPQAWYKDKPLYDIADMLAYRDSGDYLYVAGDCSRAYSPDKLEYFTRQIVFIRPGTFVIFDRVKSRDPNFKKTWLLQAMKPPTGRAPELVVTNGRGRLFVQTVLPAEPVVKLCQGDSLYVSGGKLHPPDRDTGPAPECRVEISPSRPALADYFLHVLTAADSATSSAPEATLQEGENGFTLTLGAARLYFEKNAIGGKIESGGKSFELVNNIPAR